MRERTFGLRSSGQFLLSPQGYPSSHSLGGSSVRHVRLARPNANKAQLRALSPLSLSFSVHFSILSRRTPEKKDGSRARARVRESERASEERGDRRLRRRRRRSRSLSLSFSAPAESIARSSSSSSSVVPSRELPQ